MQTFSSYIKAQKICKKAGIKTIVEYIQKYNFLGKNIRTFPSYIKAQKICKKAGIKSRRECIQKRKELGLPANPNKMYKKEWKSWYDFLGKSNDSKNRVFGN